MKLTDNFHLNEFASKDGQAVPDHLITNVRHLANQLQVLRNHIGKPIHINSGYRSPAHNARVGGAVNSMHLQGKAADITVRDISPAALATIIEKLITAGKMQIGGVGRYRGFVHIDTGGVRRWKG
jgi:uncharacterized protein YcbK (DUF882 family)